jgi:hypothetical protein
VELSTRKLVCHDRRRVAFAISASFLVLGALGWVVMGSVGSAHGYVSGEYLNCVNDSQSNLGVLEQSLTPANGATAQAGALVIFTGNSEAPPRFAVASSPALLSSPDIDSGPGSAQPFSEPHVDTYTFTSTRATITPGIIYWDASFSSSTIAECASPTPTTYTTAIRTLTILPAPTSPTPTPPTPPTPPPPATPPQLKVDISVTGFHRTHLTVTYRIDCTASCSGETSYKALVLRHHAKAVRVPKLDLGPEPVSITSPTGGDEQFTQIYSGNSLHLFGAIAHADGILELQITVKVTGTSGSIARAQHTARIRMPMMG